MTESTFLRVDGSAAALRDQFLLDPTVTFLNHGSFGACPRPVFEDYQRWQLELERQPVEFLGRRHDALLDAARARLAAYVNCPVDDLVFVPNATAGINIVARSLPLRPGDELLTTDHEYGALIYTWRDACRHCNTTYVEHRIPLPVTDAGAFVESLWSAVTPRTRVIYLSHITSPTALIFPVAEICRRARDAGIITVIDGAHAPGQIPVDLAAINPDFYTGNCHKWLCAPKGSGFLYVRPEFHALIRPLVISWGWSDDATLVQRAQQQGTRDIAAFLAVPAAIDFQQQHDWPSVRAACHQLARHVRAALTDRYGLEPIQPDSPAWFAQMVTIPLPSCDVEALKRQLYDDYRIEVPLLTFNGQPYIRVSFQGYNTLDDANRLLDALNELLPASPPHAP